MPNQEQFVDKKYCQLEGMLYQLLTLCFNCYISYIYNYLCSRSSLGSPFLDMIARVLAMALSDVKTILVVALQDSQRFTNIISSKGNSICRDFTIGAMCFIRYPTIQVYCPDYSYFLKEYVKDILAHQYRTKPNSTLCASQVSCLYQKSINLGFNLLYIHML